MNTTQILRATLVATSLLLVSSVHAEELLPGCHGTTAATYERLAQEAAAKAEAHEQMLRTHRSSSKSGQGMTAHCKRLIKQYREEEAQALAKAAEYRKEGGGCGC